MNTPGKIPLPSGVWTINSYTGNNSEMLNELVESQFPHVKSTQQHTRTRSEKL